MDVWVEYWVILGACLLGAGFVSSVEAALVAITEARVRAAVDEKVEGAESLRYWVTRPGAVLATLNCLRLMFVVGAALVAWTFVQHDLPGLPLVGFVPLLGVPVLLLAHLIPRSLAKPYALRWSIATIRIVRVATFLLTPILWPLRMLAGLFGKTPPGSDNAYWSPDEIGRITVEAEAHALGKRGQELLSSIIEFADTVIREIMVPRTEMIAIEVTSTPGEILRTIVEAGHSRVPVYEETIDNIVGVLHVKDLFNSLCGPIPGEGGLPKFDLRARARPTFYVPEVMKISELLKEFQRRKTHMAIVVDEYGGTAGVVTLEDIIEEIVGDIQDEYDVDEKQFRVLADSKVIADGRVNVWELEQALGIDFPDDADYETLAGFLVSRVGHLPRAGAVITWNGLRFTIKEANDKRIGTVEIERKKSEAAAS